MGSDKNIYDSNHNGNNIYSFEDIVDKKLGLGRYQIIVVVLLSLIFSADGIEISTLSLILPILKNEWKISETLQGLLGTVLFLGLFLGSLLAGFLIDKLGRKKTLEYVSLTQFILGIYSATLTNVYMFLLIRGLFGFLLGFIIPLIPTLCAETIPAEKRGKITVLVNISFSIGQFLASVIAWFCLDNMTKGNWRLMLAICSIPPLIVFFGSRRFLKESPRYVILTDSVEKGISIMNEIVMINNDKQTWYNRILTFEVFKELKLECNVSGYAKCDSNINEDKNNIKGNSNLKSRKNSNYNNQHKEIYFDKNESSKSTSKENNINQEKINKKLLLDFDSVKNEFSIQNVNKENNEKNLPSNLFFNYQEDYLLLKRWRDYVLSHHGEYPSDEVSLTERNKNSKINGLLISISQNKNFLMLKALFNKKYKRFTIGLWITWFCLNFTKYGLVFILPFFLNAWDQLNQENHQKLDGIKTLILTTLGEGFSGIFAYYLVDSPTFGRKYSLALGQFVSSIFILFSYFIPLQNGNYLIFSLFIARLFVKIAFAVLYPFTAEIYHTSLRTLGVGSSSATGRIGATIMPIISIKLFYINMYLPFLIYFFFGMLGLIGTLILPYDTQGKHLDVYDPLISYNSKKKISNDF